MAMNDVGLNFEIWTLPNSGDFKRKADITPWVVDRNLDVRFLDISSGALAVHNTCPYLDDIITIDPANHANDVGSTLMLFRGGTWLAAFVVVEREDRSSEAQPFTTFGVEGLEWFLERARVRAWDYPADPIREGDWLYGAPSILKTPGGEISNDITNIYREATVTSGVFTLTDGTDETALNVEVWRSASTTTGNFQLTDGTDTTSDIAWNASAATIETRIETDWTSVTDATVSGTGTQADPWVIVINTPAFVPEVEVTNNTTDGNLTVEQPLTWDATAAEMRTAIEVAFAAFTAVSVYGIGTEDFPWVIEVTDPAGTPFSVAVGTSTLDGDLFVNPIRQGGDYSPRPWHGSTDPVAGVTIGGYEGFELVTPGGIHPTSSSDFILHLDGAAPSDGGDNPGAQIEANVVGGHRYRAALRLNSPDIEMELRLSVRDLSNNTIATIDYTLNPAQGWVTVPIVDPANPGDPAGIFTMPDVSTVYVRVGILAEEGVNPGSLYVDVLDTANTYLAPGDAAKTWGEINTDLLSPITARGVLDWVTPTWTATLDSSGEAWDADRAMGIRRGQTYYQVQEYGRRWGYEWTLEYNGGAVTPFDFGLYNPGNAGTDYTGLGGPSISSIDGMVEGGVKVFRAPDATYAIAEGDAGAWGESTDAVLAAGWGRLESYFANRQNREGLSTLAARMVTDSAQQATGRRVRVQNPSNTPLDAIKIADTVPTVLPTAAGPTETLARRVMGVTIGQSDEPAPFYDFHLDSMVFDPEAAEADGLRTLIRAYEALDNLGAGGIDPLFTFQPPPPASVYTDPGSPSSLDPNNWTLFDLAENEVSRTITYPTGVVGDMIVIAGVFGPSSGGGSPSGFTQVYSIAQGNHTMYLWAKIADAGDTGSTVITTGGNGATLFASNRLVANGKTLTIADVEAQTANPSINPPALTPTTADSAYIYLALVSYESSADSAVATYPTNYTNVIESTSLGNRPSLYIGQRSVSDDSTEDPTTFAFTTGSNGDNMVATVALPAGGSAAAVAPGDHTHTENQVDDIDTLSDKATPVSADRIKIYDSEDSDLAKYTQLGDLPGGGGSGSLAMLQHQELASAATSITFSSIAGTHKHLFVVFSVRTDEAVVTSGVALQVGNSTIDTGSNYRYMRTYRGSATGSNGSASGTNILLGTVPGSSGDADRFGGGFLTINQYADTTGQRIVTGICHGLCGASNYINSDVSGVWANTASAIDTIRLVPSGGTNLVAGSSATLYGVS